MSDPPFYRCHYCHGDLFVLAPDRESLSMVCRACATCYGFDSKGLIFVIRRGIHDTSSLACSAMSATET